MFGAWLGLEVPVVVGNLGLGQPAMLIGVPAPETGSSQTTPMSVHGLGLVTAPSPAPQVQVKSAAPPRPPAS
jgi:hypothetical protein